MAWEAACFPRARKILECPGILAVHTQHMKFLRTGFKLLLALVSTIAITATAADVAKPAKPKAETYLTPEAGGRDYADQGEYISNWGGAQLIALGEDKFRLVLFKGGLPGAGWDGSARTEVEGKREGSSIVITNAKNGWVNTISSGKIITKTDTDRTYEMTRTQRTSPTLGAKPAAGAIVLFDGGNTDAWKDPHLDDRKILQSGTKTKREFTNYTLHVEFLLPFKPLGRGQDRGNSGVYMQDRYEVQVLDSFGLKGENNECGGIYSKIKPTVNMCLPPLVWQTYDIDFEAAKFGDDGKKAKNAIITIKHKTYIRRVNHRKILFDVIVYLLFGKWHKAIQIFKRFI